MGANPLNHPVIPVDDGANKKNLERLIGDVHATAALKGTGPLSAEQLRRATEGSQRLYQSANPVKPEELAQFLAIKSGKMRKVENDETVDLAAMSKGGKVPTFQVAKKEAFERCERALAASPDQDVIKGGMDGVVERLRRTLQPDVIETVAQEIVEGVAVLPQDRRWPTVQRAFEKVNRAELRRRVKDAKAKRFDAQKRVQTATETRDHAQKRLDALNYIKTVADAPVLQRLGETGFHKCVAAIQDGSCIIACVPDDVDCNAMLSDLARSELERCGDTADTHCFVVQHDWSQAFEKATDFADGAYKIPYPSSVFEFRISGSRACFAVNADEDGHPLHAALFVETPAGWALSHTCVWKDGHWYPGTPLGASLVTLCGNQVRAISIALEAEVAETEIVRAPHRLNMKRERQGKPLVLDYHLVDLAHRVRYSRRLPDPGDMDVEKTRRRLHFVRGHIRHYPNFKIFIRWHLRGDPDLGFIDKHYKL